MSTQYRRFLVNDYDDRVSIPVGEGQGQNREEQLEDLILRWLYGSGVVGGHKNLSPSFITNVPHRVYGWCANRHRVNLPNARLISRKFHGHNSIPKTKATHFVAIMGQFLDHDVTLTPESEVHDCCHDSKQ